jgi:PAS domain S-box-containing protein
MNNGGQQTLDSAFFERMVEEVGVGVAIYGSDGVYCYVNDAYAAILNTSCEELVGRGVWELVPDFERSQFEEYWESFDESETRTTEAVHEYDGTAVPVSTVTTRRTIDGRQYHFGTIQDISELTERERQLERQNERLEAFAGIVAHDLRNPLNVAISSVEILDVDIDREEVERTLSALSRMEALIDDLLTLAKQGDTPETLETVSVEHVATRAWRTVETKAASLSIAGNVSVEADSGQLQQLFENLFRNAIEHGGDTVTVEVGSLPDGTGFYVSDDGRGIASEHREEIFEPGFTSIEDGTGFGLVILSDIVEAHGWAVGVSESERGGARFEITVDEG